MIERTRRASGSKDYRERIRLAFHDDLRVVVHVLVHLLPGLGFGGWGLGFRVEGVGFRVDG